MAILLGRVGHDTVVSTDINEYGEGNRCNKFYYTNGDPNNPPPNPLPPDDELLFKVQYDEENMQKLLNSFYRPGAIVGLKYNWVGGDGIISTWTGAGTYTPPPNPVQGAGVTWKDKTCPTVLTYIFQQNVTRNPAYPDGQKDFTDTVIFEYVSQNGHLDETNNLVDGFKYVVDWETKQIVGMIPHISITVFPGSQYANPSYFTNNCYSTPLNQYNGTLNLFGFLTVPIFAKVCNEGGNGPQSVSYELFYFDETDMKS